MRLVLIEWVDSYARSVSSWEKKENIIEDESNIIIHSVGWVLFESKEKITICAHKQLEETDANWVTGEMHIPKCAIKKLTILRKH